MVVNSILSRFIYIKQILSILMSQASQKSTPGEGEKKENANSLCNVIVQNSHDPRV